MVDAALAARLDETARARSAGFVASCLSVLEEDLAELDPRAIDPRFLRSLLIRRGYRPGAVRAALRRCFRARS